MRRHQIPTPSSVTTSDVNRVQFQVMVAEIAEHRPHEFVSIRHLGFVFKGVEDTESDAVQQWAPAYENYTFVTVADGTQVVVDQDVTSEFEQYMQASWPKALDVLKRLCEDRAS